ncbi:hypothetical protein NBH20_19875 [Rhizobium sp. S153]|uniref:Uncharacterized protein n=1 Tax=Ciceribacter sichuanensis TaxID=2949647 RepID=A0ABT0VE29_9HYPH|nr:hypothetical protein [Ciceribacter sp. S153]MCM2403436.1 hypothetical protein [Ciceribacter sp. S153]
MTNNVTIDEWTGGISFSAEATAEDGRFLSLFAAPLPGCAWDRWVYTVDTKMEDDDDNLRPVAMGISYSKEEVIAEAEEAARQWLRPTPRLEAIS